MPKGHLKLWNANEAELYMNELGMENRPFFFLTSFEGNKAYIIEEDNDQLRFDIRGQQNFKHEHALKPEVAITITHNAEPLQNYLVRFDFVHQNITAGNSFLVNLTCKTPIILNWDFESIFYYSKAKYKVLLNDQMVCFSPETFVTITDGIISSFPMKGTIDADDENAESTILADAKEMAEHVTIVDLIRNDLSRVANEVKVKRFRYIDKIKTAQKTLLQVSSEIQGVLPKDYPSKIGSILFGLLPAGSISGAPKPKTIEIIKEAEGIERGFFTGICGYFDGKNLDSGVMIRYIERNNNQLYFRSGGGITFQSDGIKEYEEMQQKIYVPIY
jgi:para-aminobenzoate synthetase component 1